MAARLAEVVRAFGVEPGAIRRIAARANVHWRVTAGADVFVLRRYAQGPGMDASAAWEAEVVRDLAVLGWPVPRGLAPPKRIDGELWLLMDHVPGRKVAAGPPPPGGYRWMGRQLALLHADLERLPPRLQRPEWMSLIEATLPLGGGPAERESLLADLRAVDRDAAKRFEAALAGLEARDLAGVFAGAPRLVVHSDFSPWNVHVTGGRLIGLLDFELAHLDVLAADVAFARRGSHDGVVEGYLEVRPMPKSHLAALDGLWLGSLFFGLWRVLKGWRRDGRVQPGQLTWALEQLGKTRPYRPG